MTESAGLLAGIKVVELTDLAFAYAGRVLADLGAEVTMVEPPGGSIERLPPQGEERLPLNPGYAFMNAGKRSLTLDVDHDQARAILEKLLAEADILLTNRPQALERIGFAPKRFSAIFPRLIFATMTPFGLTGPRSHWSGSELVAWAASGILPMVGEPDRPPLAPCEGLAGFAGTLNVVMGVLMALEARDMTGRGQLVDVSLQEAILSVTLETTPALALDNGAAPVRTGNRRKTTPQGHYPAKDGAISIVAFTPWQWDALAGWIREETANEQVTDDMYKGTPADRGAFREDLDRWIEELTTRHTKQELAEEAQRRGIPVMPVNTPSDVSRDRHLEATGSWSTVPGPEGSSFVLPAPPLQVDGTRLEMGPVPEAGAHTEETLAGLGLGRTELERLRAVSAI